MRFHRLDDWLRWQRGPYPGRIDLGLVRVAGVARALDVDRMPMPVIIVAGTNGKGSSVAMLESVMGAAGYRVGAYTSPVLLSFRECLRVGGREVEDGPWMEAFDAVDRARGECALTEFEFQTLAAAVALRANGVDLAVLEVGLGGRRDAVNAIHPSAVLFTAIDVDHTDWLGDTRESVAREKAGVLRPGATAVCADARPPDALLEAARALGVELCRRDRDFHVVAGEDGWDWRGPGGDALDLPPPGIPGACQVDNAAGVVAVVRALRERFPLDDAALREGIGAARLPGRQQRLPGTAVRIVDVAHNVQAVAALAETLARTPCAGRTLTVLGALRDKDYVGMAAVLGTQTHAWHLCGLAGPRGLSGETLRAAMHRTGARQPMTVHPSPESAWRAALGAAGPRDRVVACGSFQVAQAVLRVASSPA